MMSYSVLGDTVQYFQHAGDMKKIKEVIDSQKVLNTEEAGGHFRCVGDLMSIVKEVEDDKIEDARVTKEIFQKCQLLDLLVLIMVFTGNMFCVLAYDLEYKGHTGLKTRTFVYINMILSIFSCIFILMRTIMYLDLAKVRREVELNNSIWSSGMWKFMFCEWMLLLIQPYPFFIGHRHTVYNNIIKHDIYYHLNDYLQLLSLFRYVYLVSSFLNFTMWRSSSADRICKMYGCEANTAFAVRSLMLVNPSVFNTLLYLGSIMLFAQGIRICEAPIARVSDEMNHFDYINAIWSVILTMTTVGYGDIYPRTTIGRIVYFLCAMFGVVVVSMIVVTVMNMLEMTTTESKAFTVIKRTAIRKDLVNSSSTLISRAMKLHLKIKKRQAIETKAVYKFNQAINEFKSISRDYKNETDVNQNENMFREFENLKNTNKELMMYLSVLASMVDTLMKNNDAHKHIKDENQLKIMKVLTNAHNKKPDLARIHKQEVNRDYKSELYRSSIGEVPLHEKENSNVNSVVPSPKNNPKIKVKLSSKKKGKKKLFKVKKSKLGRKVTNSSEPQDEAKVPKKGSDLPATLKKSNVEDDKKINNVDSPKDRARDSPDGDDRDNISIKDHETLKKNDPQKNPEESNNKPNGAKPPNILGQSTTPVVSNPYNKDSDIIKYPSKRMEDRKKQKEAPMKFLDDDDSHNYMDNFKALVQKSDNMAGNPVVTYNSYSNDEIGRLRSQLKHKQVNKSPYRNKKDSESALVYSSDKKKNITNRIGIR